jgi:hypothetical protein
MEYRLKRHDESVYADLRYLFREANGADIPEEFFKKKYDTAWTGKKFIGYTAFDENGRPAASYAVLPCFARFKGEKILAAQIVDVVTHPAHRMKGLFVLVAQKTHELAKAEGIKYLLGFPNKNSYPGFVKYLGCIHTEDLQQFTVKTKALPLLKAANKFRLFRPFYNAYSNLLITFMRPQKRFLPSSVLTDGCDGIEHTADFFSYKSFGGNYLLKTGNFTVWVKAEDGFILGDISRFEEKEFEKFDRAMKRLCFLFGVHQYTAASSPGAFIDRVFSRKYQAYKGIAVIYLDLNMPVSPDEANLKYVLGDSDTF